jgi:hypothetical protein
MSVEPQLQYESRVRSRQTAVAALAGVLIVAAAIIQLGGPHAKVDELTLDLITENKRHGIDLLGSIINALGLITLGWTLAYLFGIARARNPQLQPFIRYLAVIGAVLSGLSAIAYEIVITQKASEFVSHGAQTYVQANALTSGGLVVALPLVAQIASLLLTAGFIWISLSAMRVGLLTRFMGYLGVFAGILVLFPIGSPVPVVQGFWLLGVAVLIAGRWPSGQPKAWSSGQAEPWPSSASVRAQQAQARSARGGAGRGGAGRGGASQPTPARAFKERRGLRKTLEAALVGGGAAGARRRQGTAASDANDGAEEPLVASGEPVGAAGGAGARGAGGSRSSAGKRKRKRKR